MIYCIISFVALLLISCNSESNSDKESQQNTESTDNKDVTNNEDVSDAKQSTESITLLEDFTRFNNHNELEDYFGAENVLATEMWVEEGTELFLVSIIHPQHKNQIILYWNQTSDDYSDLFKIEAIYSSYNHEWDEISIEGETYASKTGIKIHDDIKKLEEINGEPFNFWGLGWDYGGYAYNLQSMFEGYVIRLDATTDFVDSDEGWKKYVNITGELELSSDSKDIQDIPLRIYSIAYNVK